MFSYFLVLLADLAPDRPMYIYVLVYSLCVREASWQGHSLALGIPQANLESAILHTPWIIKQNYLILARN